MLPSLLRWPLAFNFPCKVLSTKPAIKQSWHAWSSKFPYSQYLAHSTTRHSHALMDSPLDWIMRPIFVHSAWTLTLPPKCLRRAWITFTGSLLSSSVRPSVLLFGLINLFMFEGRVARSVDMQRFCFLPLFFPILALIVILTSIFPLESSHHRAIVNVIQYETV